MGKALALQSEDLRLRHNNTGKIEEGSGVGQALWVSVATWAAEMVQAVWKLIGQQAGRAEWRKGAGSKRGRAGTTSYDAWCSAIACMRHVAPAHRRVCACPLFRRHTGKYRERHRAE